MGVRVYGGKREREKARERERARERTRKRERAGERASENMGAQAFALLLTAV